ncbi:hypothetical protein [Sulfurimonas sp.]|uniref:hypothetical protein n=1 Tax=Sulfurimonas sp. TaxID=2022749 RepID=UPI002619BBAC|nr:hypothetical protein [Sulfurimonas sp.]
MRFLLFLVISTLIFAKTQETCYTVQLTSFKLKKNSTYNFKLHNYPDSCQLVKIKSLYTVRCGCYNRYGEAKHEQKELFKDYNGTLIIKTYKYRFKKPIPKRSEVKEHTIPNAAPLPVTKEVSQPSQEKSVSLNAVEEPNQLSFMDYMSYRGDLNWITQSYLIAPKDKNPENITLNADLEATYKKDALQLHTKIKLQQDLNDLESGAKDTHRSYARIDELYGEYEFDESQVLVGKSIRFWGALEVRNIADVFNPYDLRADPFYKTKLGVINAEYTCYTETGELSFIVQLYEQPREMSAYPYVYYYFPKDITYSKDLKTQHGRYRPNIYVKYSDSYEGDAYSLDYNVIFQNGYDSQRYYTTHLIANNEIETNEHAYLVNKFITYDTLVSGATLYKLEAIFTDVLNNDQISDYSHLGLGVEHTILQVYDEADLGLLAEYYSYDTIDGSKRNDLQLFEVFQNDLFLGVRYSFNKGDDSTIVGGGIFDLDYDEDVYYFEYKTRIADSYKITFDYRYIEPSKNDPTVFNLMGRHQRISLKVGYYF